MTPDVQLAQDYPYTRPDAGENSSPCKLLEEADKMLTDLESGRLKYVRYDTETGAIVLRDTKDHSIKNFTRGHYSAIKQYRDGGAVHNKMLNNVPERDIIAQSRHDMHLPVRPNITTCLTM